jgi:hypothetical protein
MYNQTHRVIVLVDKIRDVLEGKCERNLKFDMKIMRTKYAVQDFFFGNLYLTPYPKVW